jgi:hypothetical protein
MAMEAQLEQSLKQQLLEEMAEGIPEYMDPGTVFVLRGQGRLGAKNDPYVAAISCPRCALIGLITRQQLCEAGWMICGGDSCSYEWCLKGETIFFRKPQ